MVGAVEVPVPEAPDDVGRVRRRRRGGDGLRVLEDIDPVGRLDLEAGHPPEAGPQRQHADAQHGAAGVTPCRLPEDHHGIEDPEDGRDADVDDGAGVDAAHQRHDDGEERGLAPAAAAQGHDGQAEHEGEAGPREQDHRDAARVLEEVRGEHVGERGGGRSGPAEAEDARQVQHAEARREEDGAEPEALRHPHGHAEQVEHGEERPHRQQVADVLVGDGAQGNGGVPHERDLAQEAQRVEVEVGLRVRRDDPGPHGQERHVGQDGHDRRPPDPPPPVADRPFRPWGRVPPSGNGDRG